MASIENVTFLNAVNVASNTSTDSQTVPQNSTSFIGFLKLENYVAGTYTVIIEHSADKASWETLASFAAASADGFEYVQITDSVLPQVRANITVAGGDADLTVQLWYDPNK